MTIVYIPIEITKRELDSKILLATNLANNGIPTVVGQKSIVYRFLEKASKPGLVFYKSSSPTPLQKFKNEIGHKFFAQDEEAGIVGTYEDFYKQRFGAIDMADKTDRYFVWSQEEYDFLVKKLHMDGEKIVNSGGLRTILWGSKGLSFYKKDTKELQKKFGKYILFILTHPVATSYSQSIYKFSEYQILVDKFINKLIISIIEIILSRTDLNVVIRPHPAGSPDFWNKYFKGNSRVEINGEGTLLKWVLGSYCVLHDGSTGAFEAAVANIPTICIQREHFISNKYDMADFSKTEELSLKPKTMTHLLEILKNPESPWSEHQVVRDKLIKQYLTHSSSIKILNIITEEILKECQLDFSGSESKLKRDLKSEIQFNLMYKIPKIFLFQKIFIMERQKRTEISKKVVKDLCSRSKEVLSIPSGTNILVKQLSFSTFLLYKSNNNTIKN